MSRQTTAPTIRPSATARVDPPGAGCEQPLPPPAGRRMRSILRGTVTAAAGRLKKIRSFVQADRGYCVIRKCFAYILRTHGAPGRRISERRNELRAG